MNKLKDKITKLSREHFEYELPEIICSEEKISIAVETGKVYRGVLKLKNKEGRNMKGLVYSSSHLLFLENDSFDGREVEIGYEFRATDIRTKDVIHGTISIVSSCGEKEIPFQATILEKYVEASFGEVKDLFHFANLAKLNWTKAVSIFKSQDFEGIFLRKDLEKKMLYRGLCMGSNPEQALEEFLVSIQKKNVPKLSVSKEFYSFQVRKEDISGEIVLRKDTWGYLDIDVWANHECLEIDQKKLNQDSFIGDEVTLQFQVKNENLRPGKNFAKIVIENMYQKIEVHIEMEKVVKHVDRDYDEAKRKRYEMVLLNHYINFRSNRIDAVDYIAETRNAVTKLQAIEVVKRNLGELGYTRRLDLYQFHLFIVEGDQEKAEAMFESLQQEEHLLKKNTVEEYCGFLYLKALYTRTKENLQIALQEIRECYKQHPTHWKLLWFLIFLDEKLDQKPEEKLKAIKEQYKRGCTSPVLYYEVCSVYEQDPTLLKELDPCTIQSFNMGVKQDMFSLPAAVQYAYLAEKEKGYHRIILSNLVTLYEKYQDKQILEAICSLLIKSDISDSSCFAWYEAGVKEQLHLTQLHEYYIYSIDENYKGILPREIYMYFLYNANLPEDKKAYLYANIITHKDELSDIVVEYREQIRNFTIEQLYKHHFNQHLAELYPAYIREDQISAEIAKHLPFVMFKRMVVCKHKDIVGVTVAHKECVKELYYPFDKNGRAFVDIYTEHARVLLVDRQGRRYDTSIPTEKTKFISRNRYAEACYEKNKTNFMLSLYIYERIERYQKNNINMAELQDHVDQDLLQPEYRKKWVMNLIQHYYDNYEGEALEKLLLEVDLQGMSKSERNLIIEYCIIRGLYDLAFEQIAEYSFEGITVKRLRALCSKTIKKYGMEEENPLLSKMGFYVFKAGKYDEIILQYLVKYYLGTTKDMFLVWKEAKEYDMNTEELEERLLGQVLFAESYIPDTMAVFFSYYGKEKNRTLVKAFISYYSYKYFVRDRIIDEDFIEIVNKELQMEPNRAALLALLKYYSTFEKWTEEQRNFIETETVKLLEEGIRFPFFKKFVPEFQLPGNIGNKYFVEYKTNPKHKVLLHYFLEDEQMQEEFLVEQMEDMYEGIFVRDFTLFHNETLQYYVEEIPLEGDPIITESITIRGDELQRMEEEDKYSQINMMLVAREMKDEKTLLSLIQNYAKTEYAMGKVFKGL